MAARPTGTVTFVFTDIEGATALLQRLGESYGEVLLRTIASCARCRCAMAGSRSRLCVAARVGGVGRDVALPLAT